MGKASLERERQRQEQLKLQEKANQSWYKKYAAPIAAVATLGLATTGYFTSRYLDGREQVRQELALNQTYADLLPYRDEIVKKMVAEPTDGIYDYENFLPKLKLAHGKLHVKVYLGEPPEGLKLKVAAIPNDFKEHAMQGLEKWNEFFEFIVTKNYEEADIKIMSEGEIFARHNVAGRAMLQNKKTQYSYWSQFTQDSKLLGNVILYNSKDAEHIRQNPDYFKATIAHEFGHFMGLQHPDTIFFFDIKEIGGIKDPTKFSSSVVGNLLDQQYKLYPQFPQLSIMTASGSSEESDLRLGDLDKRAMTQVLKMYIDKYIPNKKVPDEWKGFICAGTGKENSR